VDVDVRICTLYYNAIYIIYILYIMCNHGALKYNKVIICIKPSYVCVYMY
jgi:hypothetical protein